MNLSTSRSGTLAAVVLAAIGVLLAWQVITRTFVAYLAAAAPERALWYDASEPLALVDRANRALNLDAGIGATAAAGKAATASQPPERLAFNVSGGEPATAADKRSAQPSVLSPARQQEIRAWLALALQRDPVNARAVRMLGQLADAAGDHGTAEKFMSMALRRSLRETVAAYWLLQRKTAANDHAAALHLADVLLRTRSQFIRFAMPALVKAAETETAVAPLTQLLAGNPPWRPEFFAALPFSITDARTPLGLLLALKASPAPTTMAEVKGYLDFLLQHKFYDLSYYTWLQLLSAEQLANAGFLFNGSFESNLTTLPFDWVFHNGQGVTIDIASRPDQPGHRALLIHFNQGRVAFEGVNQVIMLGPGSYQLKGLTQGEITGRRGLVWRITCLGSTADPVGQSPTLQGRMPAWKEFEIAFTVPQDNCRAQRISLLHDARSPSEQLISGTIWFDELRIARTMTAE